MHEIKNDDRFDMSSHFWNNWFLSMLLKLGKSPKQAMNRKHCWLTKLNTRIRLCHFLICIIEKGVHITKEVNAKLSLQTSKLSNVIAGGLHLNAMDYIKLYRALYYLFQFTTTAGSQGRCIARFSLSKCGAVEAHSSRSDWITIQKKYT